MSTKQSDDGRDVKTSQAFNRWMIKLLDARNLNLNQTKLAELAGVSRATINRGFNQHKWSENTITSIFTCLNLSVPTAEELASELFDRLLDTITNGISRNSKNAKSLMIALSRMARQVGDNREQAFDGVLDSVQSDRPAFFAIVTMAVMPSSLDGSADSARLRESLYAAHTRGLMLLFIVPDAATADYLRGEYGYQDVPVTEAYQKGFDCYRQEFLDWCRLNNQAEQAQRVDDRMQLLHYDHFEVTHVRAIMALLGDNGRQAKNVEMCVIERSPATDGALIPVHRNAGLERGLSTYIANALTRSRGQVPRSFVKEFCHRMGIPVLVAM